MTDGLAIERTVAATPDAVYDAWTTPSAFAAWWGGDQVAVPLDRLVFDAHQGASWSAVMVLPDGTELPWAGEFVALERPGLVSLTLTDQPAAPERETLTAELTAVEDGTLMRVTQTGGHLTPEQYEQTSAGYQSFFDAMESLLAPGA